MNQQQQELQQTIVIKPEHRQEIERRATAVQSAQAEAARLLAQAQQQQQLAGYAQEALTAYLENEYSLKTIGEQWHLDVARGVLLCRSPKDTHTQEKLAHHVQ